MMSSSSRPSFSKKKPKPVPAPTLFQSLFSNPIALHKIKKEAPIVVKKPPPPLSRPSQASSAVVKNSQKLPSLTNNGKKKEKNEFFGFTKKDHQKKSAPKKTKVSDSSNVDGPLKKKSIKPSSEQKADVVNKKNKTKVEHKNSAAVKPQHKKQVLKKGQDLSKTWSEPFKNSKTSFILPEIETEFKSSSIILLSSNTSQLPKFDNVASTTPVVVTTGKADVTKKENKKAVVGKKRKTQLFVDSSSSSEDESDSLVHRETGSVEKEELSTIMPIVNDDHKDISSDFNDVKLENDSNIFENLKAEEEKLDIFKQQVKLEEEKNEILPHNFQNDDHVDSDNNRKEDKHQDSTNGTNKIEDLSSVSNNYTSLSEEEQDDALLAVNDIKSSSNDSPQKGDHDSMSSNGMKFESCDDKDKGLSKGDQNEIKNGKTEEGTEVNYHENGNKFLPQVNAKDDANKYFSSSGSSSPLTLPSSSSSSPSYHSNSKLSLSDYEVAEMASNSKPATPSKKRKLKSPLTLPSSSSSSSSSPSYHSNSMLSLSDYQVAEMATNSKSATPSKKRKRKNISTSKKELPPLKKLKSDDLSSLDEAASSPESIKVSSYNEAEEGNQFEDKDSPSPLATDDLGNGDAHSIASERSIFRIADPETPPQVDENLCDRKIVGGNKFRTSHFMQSLPDDQAIVDKFSFSNDKFRHLVHVESDPNGHASILHAYQHELDAELSDEEMKLFAWDFCNLSYHEENPSEPSFVMGVVHDSIATMPDFLEYMAQNHADLNVTTEHLGRRDTSSMTIREYRKHVHDNFCKESGQYTYGPMRQISLTGTVNDEAGAYLPDVLDMLEENHFLNITLPWGRMSHCRDMRSRNHSNDGPIMWVRPGEQMVPSGGAKNLTKGRRRSVPANFARQYSARSIAKRETFIEDRTHAHADHVGHIEDRQTTWAVGALKSVSVGNPPKMNKCLKDVICFHSSSFLAVTHLLQLDVYEPPMSQCTQWVDEGKLNLLRQEGIRYCKLRLYDNDVYFIPRNIVHQFRTVASSTSVAWHLRLRDLHGEPTYLMPE